MSNFTNRWTSACLVSKDQSNQLVSLSSTEKTTATAQTKGESRSRNSLPDGFEVFRSQGHWLALRLHSSNFDCRLCRRGCLLRSPRCAFGCKKQGHLA